MSIGTDVLRAFGARPGSTYIASAFAIDGLVEWLRRVRPRTVLEVGAGIGTLTSVSIQQLDAIHGPGSYRYVAIEAEPFCLGQFDANIGADRGKVTLADRYEAIPAGMAPFDFVIVDGGGPYAEDGDSDLDFVSAQNRLYASELAPHGVVFVEKDRHWQRETIRYALRDRACAYCHYQPWTARPGYHIYRFEPTPGEERELSRSNMIGDLDRSAISLARSVKRVLGSLPQALRPGRTAASPPA